jgi:hypothetical protein
VDSVRNTLELRRVRDLPRRELGRLDELADAWTEALCTHGGAMVLRPMQAAAVSEIAQYDGLFAPLGVGEGKTLITLLAPYVLNAKRPLLLLPANLIEKTTRDRAALQKHWLIPNHVYLMSYEMLGRVQSSEWLQTYAPDLIVADEVHKLKNRRAAVTRRVQRYMHERPETRFVGLSGTIMRKSLLEFGHILRWCLKENAPIPSTQNELEEWAAALDEDMAQGNELARLDPGALLTLCNEDDLKEAPMIAARRGFRRRLVETPGVVATTDNAERVDCSIHIRAVTYAMSDVTEKHFQRLRGAWETPDGWPLMQGVDVWRHARELALGLHYVRVEKQRFLEWLAEIPRDDAPSRENIGLGTLKGSEPMTGRGAEEEVRNKRGIGSSGLAMGLSPANIKNSTQLRGGGALSVTKSRSGEAYIVDSASITITERDECEDSSALLAIEQSVSSMIPSKAYCERFNIFVETARPPAEWLDARRVWAALVRETLSRSRTLDSELQVMNAVDAGILQDGGALERWRAVREIFDPCCVPVWHDESALKTCQLWMQTPGIVWTEHAFFAQRLAQVTGASYYGAKGLDQNGRFIDDAPPGTSAIVSIDANREGRNLQTKWHRNLVVSPPEGADVWQQMIGRTHRPGQAADEVIVDVLLGCAEHANAWRKALAGARSVRDTTGAESKLLLADIEWPDDVEIAGYRGARWRVTKEKEQVST